LTNFVRGLLGEDEDLKSYKIEDFQWLMIETGFIAYRKNQAYYVRVEIRKIVKDNQFEIMTDPS
jgi:hypothetical protein